MKPAYNGKDAFPALSVLHRLDVFVRFRLMGMKGKVEYKPLTEERAVEQGAEILGEAFLYSVAAGYIVYEYWRSGKKEQMKEDTQNHDISLLKVQTENLEQQMSQLQQTLDSLRTELHTHLKSQSRNQSQKSTEKSSKSWWIFK